MAASIASASKSILTCRSELSARQACPNQEASASPASLSFKKYASPFTPCAVSGSSRSSFSGASGHLIQAVRAVANAPSSAPRAVVAMEGAVIQFIRGVDELSVPDVRLTRSVDGNSGTATFQFEQPSVFDSSRELGEITGLYLIDDEGIIQSVDVSAKFVNGKPAKIEARHIMRTGKDWDRFMRFMERYAEKNNLGFVKK